MNRRILIVVNVAFFFVSHRLPLALRAQAKGYDVQIVTPPGPETEIIQDAGLPWHPINFTRSGMRPWEELRAIAQLTSLYRRLKPDIVHHVTIKPVLYGSLAARLAGVPRVINAISGMGYMFTGRRGLKSAAATLLYKGMLRHPDLRLILQNGEDYEFFRSANIVPLDRLHLIRGSGVDVEMFSPAPEQRLQPPVVIQTCRMLADKGVREFTAAARMVKAARKDVRFMLVGPLDPGNPAAIPEAELQAAVADGAVEWLGNRRDIPDLLRQASIYCLPSYREGLPKSLIEAAACGLPLIATDIAGCREVIQHGETGLLVPPTNAEAIASAVNILLDDPAFALRIATNARQRTLQEFTVEKIADQQIDLYAASPSDAIG